MSDVSAYGVTQNADAAMVTADELVGERSGSIRENAVFGSAASFSTAPYRPTYIDGRLASRVGKCPGKNDTCQAAPIQATGRCWFHTPDDELPERKP
jgi:hypothetical protein